MVSNFGAFIVRLFLGRSPSAIFRGIRTVIVSPVKRVVGRGRLAHIFPKAHKRSTPSTAYINTPSTVPRKVFVRFVVAALDHALPGLVKARPRQPVSGKPANACFPGKTPTAFRIPDFQASPADTPCYAASTVASTMPIGNRVLVHASITDNGQSTKVLPRKIFKTPVGWFRIGISHICLLTGGVVRAIRGVMFLGGSPFLVISNPPFCQGIH